MSAALFLPSRPGLTDGGGQGQGGVVAADVQGGDGEQVPQGPAGAVALAVVRQPGPSVTHFNTGSGWVDAAHGEGGP